MNVYSSVEHLRFARLKGNTVRASSSKMTEHQTEKNMEHRMEAVHVGDCQNCGPFLGPYYNTGPNLGDPKGTINFDNSPCVLWEGFRS